MSIADLKNRMSDVPGIEGLTMRADPAQSRMVIFTIGDHVAATDADASDQDIETAIRRALRLPSIALIPDKPKGTPMSVTGAGYAGGSLSQRLRAIRQKVEAGSAKMDGALSKMEQAADAHSQLADTVEGEADALLAEIGQFTNGGVA